MSWRATMIGRATGMDSGHEDFEEMLEEVYEKGKEKGYRKAMREMEGGYGERSGYSGSANTYMGKGYGHRDGMDDDEEDDYGERRGVRGTGVYSRYTRAGYRRRY